MDFIVALFNGTNIASVLVYICLTAFVGLLLGKLNFKGVKLGIAGVLFMGIFLAHEKNYFGSAPLNPEILHFVKEFGLILFVYGIGINVGPRFASSFKNDGLKLNGLAALHVLLGVIVTICLFYITGLDKSVIVGILSGAVTNTPSLGAAQQALGDNMTGIEQSGMAYAMAYPFGVIGIITTILLIRAIFRIKVKEEEKIYTDQISNNKRGKLESVQVKVTNTNLIGRTIKEFKELFGHKLVLSRILRNNQFDIIHDEEILQEGDVIFGVSTKDYVPTLEMSVGPVELGMKREVDGSLAMFEVLVTNRKIAGRTIEQIGIYRRYEANITRIFRAGVEILPTLNTTIEMGDTVRVVGKKTLLPEIQKEIGNSLQQLAVPNAVAIFLGIFMGILLGSIPIAIPGLPASAKLGLAGGPLIVALLLGHKGRLFNIDFYMAPGANAIFKELGIILFLGSVGLSSGTNFVETFSNGGYTWMLYGMAITFIPAVIVAVIARLMKFNYLKICGFLSGVTTNPPALEYANSIAPVQAQSTAYATVYPLSMFLRILTAQILILIL
ncbi:MAG: putative transporter [Paludibacteraceae bacterium]|nr:putative transporter [Paludibacteraceae bacterium]